GCIPPANVSAYQLSTGAAQWTTLVARFPARLRAALALGGGKLFAAARFQDTPNDGSAVPASGLYALNPATGATQWSRVGSGDGPYSAIATDGASVYVTLMDAYQLKVRALDATDGHELFTSPSLGSVSDALPPALGYVGGRLLVLAQGQFAP